MTLEEAEHLTAIIQNLTVAVASSVGAWAAVCGLRTWRKELRGKKEHDLAEETLIAFFKARDAIRRIRDPLGRSDEGKSDASDGLGPDEKRARETPRVVSERFGREQEIFSSLDALRPRFAALFGEDGAQPFGNLREIVWSIIAAAGELGDYAESPPHFAEDDQAGKRSHQEHMRSLRQTVRQTHPHDDLQKKVDAVVAEIQSTCLKILRR